MATTFVARDGDKLAYSAFIVCAGVLYTSLFTASGMLRSRDQRGLETPVFWSRSRSHEVLASGLIRVGLVVSKRSGSSQEKTPAQVLASYMDMISVTDMQLTDIFKNVQFGCIRPLLQKVLCVPASSAPVERVFSQSGLIMKPNRARMSDALLGELVFLDCNDF